MFFATILPYMRAIGIFFGEVKTELSKVVWPTRDEVIKLTLIVFIVSGMLGAYVGGLDFLFTSLLTQIVK